MLLTKHIHQRLCSRLIVITILSAALIGCQRDDLELLFIRTKEAYSNIDTTDIPSTHALRLLAAERFLSTATLEDVISPQLVFAVIHELDGEPFLTVTWIELQPSKLTFTITDSDSGDIIQQYSVSSLDHDANVGTAHIECVFYSRFRIKESNPMANYYTDNYPEYKIHISEGEARDGPNTDGSSKPISIHLEEELNGAME